MVEGDKALLNGCRVIVTRPQQQSQRLSTKLEQLGAEVLRFPLIEIVFSESDPLKESGQVPDQYQHYIFISRNAVEAAGRVWPDIQTVMNNKAIYAIGVATAEALREKGYEDITSCPGKGGSEAFLNLEAMSTENIQGQSVLILRGKGGRELLRQTLQQRGGSVDYADLYERRRPCYDIKEIQPLWKSGTGWQILVLTSVEALENLVTISESQFSNQLYNSRLLVLSERIAEAAGEKGFNNEILVAESSSDDGIIQTLVTHFNEDKE